MRLAITSCAKYEHYPEQPVWSEIKQASPDALLLLGDNVYLDKDGHTNAEALAADLRARYDEQLSEPHFKALLSDLRARGKPVMAIWDDHDSFGNDQCGGDYPAEFGEAARAEFHRALPFSVNRPEIYCRRDIGEVSFLLLDVRSYRKDRQTDKRNPDAVLGAKQWQWLEVQLTNANRYNVIASGTTLYPHKRECWDDYPKARKRMIGLLAGKAGALFMSGDVHENQLNGGDNVIEVTSSGCARNSIFSKQELRNYGIVDFFNDRLEVSLHGLRPEDQVRRTIALADWRYV